MSYYLNLETNLFLIIIYSFFTETSGKIFSSAEMKKICSESEDYISLFFSRDKELDEKYLNYDTNTDFLSKNKYIIQMLFLNQDALTKYKEEKLNKYNFYSILFMVLFVLSIIITIIFNGHFFYKLCGNKKEELENDKKLSFSKFYKISPFAWIRYLFCGKEKKEKFYTAYKNKKYEINKFLKIFIILISFVLMITSVILAIYNNRELNSSETTIYNISCAMMKFLYEIKNGPFRQNNFIGLEQIKVFFNEFNTYNKNSDENLEKYDESFNVETKNLISDWENYINNLNNELKNSEFYIKSYPSNLNYTKGDIEKCSSCEKNTYQIKNIYDYYPSTDSSKTLYNINQSFHNNIDSIYNSINKINDNILTNKNTNTEENENLYMNIFETSNNILDIYIDKFVTEYLPNFHESLIKDNFSFLYNIDFAYLIVLVMICILFIPLLLYTFCKKFSDNNLFMIFLFFECLFSLMIISMISSRKILYMKIKITYIDDLTKAVYFLFDEENQGYFEGNSEDYEIENTQYTIKDEDGFEKNIFYFLNYIINNDGKVSELFDMNFANIKIKEINELSEQLNKIINNKVNLMNQQLTNSYITNSENSISKIINTGLDANTYFNDINGKNMVYPSLYLSYINSFTMFKNEEYSDCDELWNISTTSFGEYVYKKKEEAIKNNHYYRKNDLNTPALLNYLEFTLDEILTRYNDLLNNKQEMYYGIINQFKSLEYFRKDDIVISQLQKLKEYNEYLNKLESNIFDLLKQNVLLSKEITDSYISKFNKYSSDQNNLFSFLDCDFIKKDLYFVLGEINTSFISSMEKFCKNHLLVNLINILLSTILIIFYSLISYEIPLTGKHSYSERKTGTSPIKDSKKEIEKIKNKNGKKDIDKESKQKEKKSSNRDNSFDFLRGGAFMNSNIGGNVSIVRGGNNINNNNIAPQMNTFGINGNPLNDVMNINKLINPIQKSINDLFTNNMINGLPNINLDAEILNNIDHSKAGMIDDMKKEVVNTINNKKN